MRPTSLALAALFLAAPALSACGAKKHAPEYSNSYEGQRPPALALADTTWLNVEGSPTLDTFRGKVVFLEFGFLR